MAAQACRRDGAMIGRRVAEAVAYRLGQKAGQTWDDLRSTVSREGWRRGGHMRRLPVDLLVPGLLEAGAFLSAIAAAQYKQFTLWFIKVSGNIELAFAPAARLHARMWIPSQLFLIILFLYCWPR